MIKSFGDKRTEEVFNRKITKGFPAELIKLSYRKLLLLDASDNLNDLKIPPGNRLEKLSGNLEGFYSIRINSKWRIIFKWLSNNACEVKITDYH